MKYYIAIDGGGTKINALLFNQNFEQVAFSVGASVNTNFSSAEDIKNNIKKCFDNLFLNVNVSEIENLYNCCLCDTRIIEDAINEHAKIINITLISEGIMGMYANYCVKDGIIALSGTGSGIWLSKDGQIVDAAGGYGAIVADEGSGYYIGRMALRAAIHNYENRGDATILNDLITQYLNPNSFRESVFSIYNSDSQVRTIASLSRLVSEAAKRHDKVAIKILKESAKLLAQQVNSLIKKYNYAAKYPIMVMGGSFKNYNMFKYFKQYLLKMMPDAIILEPLFDPLMGGVIAAALDNKIELNANFKKTLTSNFKEFIYKID